MSTHLDPVLDASRAFLVREPQDWADALMGLALGWSDALFPTASRMRCEAILLELANEDPGLWMQVWHQLLRGVGVTLEDTLLGGCSIRTPHTVVCDGAGNEPPEGTLGVFLEGMRGPLGEHVWSWGDVDDEADTTAQLETCAIDPFVVPGCASIAAAACISDSTLARILMECERPLWSMRALRHLLWSARRLGRWDAGQMLVLAQDIVQNVSSPGALAMEDVGAHFRDLWYAYGQVEK